MLNANGVLYFTASNSANGRELWKLDPTTGNPVFLKDIYVGSSSSNPGNLTYSNGKLYFTADNGVNGVELWTVNVDQITTIGVVEKTGDEDQVIPFTANDFASVFNSGSGVPLAKIKIINLPSNGLLKLNNSPVAVEQEIAVANLGNLTFTPNTNYNGIAGFTWNGSDGTNYALNPSTVALTINSINDVPTVVNPITDTSIFSNRSSNFAISANTFQDSDVGDSLTYSATLADGSPLPSWLTFNERTFSGNPSAAQAGQYDLKVIATDQSGASTSDSFVLSVVNSAPWNITLDNSTVPENSANNTVIGLLSASDNNTNDTHTFSLINNAGGRFAIVNNQLVVADGSLLDYETNTQHTIRVKATDNTGLSYENNLTIFISNVADDLAGVLSFTAAAFSVNENGTLVNAVTLQRTNGSEGTVSVNVLLSNGTAVFPDDYNSLAVPVVFGPGETSKTVTLPIVNDSDFEGNETLNLTLSSPTGGATLGTQTTATLTIVDNDLPTVSLAVSPASVTEDGTINLVYTFTRTGNTANPLTVSFNVGGNATFNNDYTQNGAASFNATSGTITFAAGSDTATLTIDPTADTIFEQDETVSLTLVSSANYNRGTTNTVTSTIINDDVNAGVLSFSNSQFGVNEDGTVVNAVTINRTGNTTGAVSVTVNLTNGTATAPSDYNNTPITVNFANGETSKTVTIPIVNDSQLEADETFNLSLSNPQGGAILGTQTTAVLTILNDDLPQRGSINLNNSNYTVNENGTANITLTRTNGSDGEVSVILTPSNGSAVAGDDYTNTPITVNFANGETSKTVTIPIVSDNEFEFYETVNLTLTNPTGGATLGNQSTGKLIISPDFTLNGVAKQTLDINNTNPVLRLTDGLSQSGSAFLTNRISLENNASFSTAFQFQISNPQGIADNDGQGADGLVFVVQTVANNTGGSGGGIGYSGINPSLGIEFDTYNNGSIDDDSGNHVGININGNIDSVVLQPIPTRLNNGNIWTAWVDYNGVDSLLEVRLASTNQRPDNPLFSYSVDLISVLQTPNAYIGFTSGTGAASGYHDILSWNFNTTYNPISAGKIAFSSPSYSINENGSIIAAVTINRTGGSFGEVSVTLTPSNGSAIAPNDYNNTPITVTFANGETSKTVTIPIVDDTIYEPTETVNLTISNPTGGATLGTQQTATLTIIDNDAVPGVIQFSNATYSINEDGAAISPITITRTGGTDGAVSVTLNLSNGTATAPNDYTNSSPITVNFASGEKTKTVNITIINDLIREGDETVNLVLSNPTGGANLGTQTTATLTIADNDIGLDAQYFDGYFNDNLSFFANNQPVLKRTDKTVNFLDNATSWNLSNTILSDLETFSVRWQGFINITTAGNYTFYLNSDDASYLFLDGATQSPSAANALINNGGIHPPREISGTTYLQAGFHQILIVFGENNFNNVNQFSWSSTDAGIPKQIVPDSVLFTLNSTDSPAFLSFSATNYTVNEENGTIDVTVTRSGRTSGEVTAKVSLTNGTATYPNDYNQNSFNITFADVETSKTVAIPIVNDTKFEANETINLALTNLTGGATLGNQNSATITIISEDPPQPGAITFSNSQFSINENGTPVTQVTLTRTNGSDGEVTVILTPSNGSATAGDDYTNTPITVTFANGETSKIVTIPINNDTIYEPTETVNLTLSNPTGGATLGTQQTATLTIIDNDAVPGVIQFSNATYSVNENGTPVTAVTLTRSNGSDGAVSVRINLTNGTATAPSDYNNTAITVNFANGETSKTVTIPIIDDSIFEATETINLSLSNPTNGVTIGSQNSAIVNIIDNDFKPTLTVNISSEQVTEGNIIQGTVTRNTDTTDPLTVTLVSSDNTQLTVPTTITIPAGSNSVNFNLNAVDDTLIELAKNYTIIATAQGFVSGSDTLAIIDNDAVTLTLDISLPSQGGSGGIYENGGKATATVTRNLVTDTPLQVQLSSSNTAAATVPATVIIPANQASATFEIQAIDNTILDGTKSVTITAKPTYTATNTALPTGNATANINIIDNESPSLKVVIDKDVISETGTATATITRNTDTSSDLIVTLNSSDTTEATVPNTVTIAAGQTSATFTITGISDGINDGSQTVTITASATGLNSGSDSLEITDINVPDLVLTQLQGISPTYTTKQSQFTYTVTNNGIIAATGSWKDRVYLSTDNKLDTNDTLLGEFGLGSTENPANLLPGTSYNRTVTYFAPRNPGQYYLIGVTDNGNTVNEGVTIGESNNTTITPVTVTPAYRGTVYSDTETAIAGNPVTLRGQALSNSDNSPVAYEFVKVRVENKGNIREFDAFTDGNGNFVRQFTPLSGEAGTYNINAYFPGFASEDSTPEDSFTLLGMRFEQNDQFLTQVSQRITEGTTFNGSVKLQNLSNLGLSGLTATVNGAPSDWTVNVTPEKTSLGGNEEITVNYSINVPDDKWSYYNFGLGLSTTEGVTANLPIRVDVARLLPRLVADTSSLQASMLRGGQTIVEFTVSNQGEVASGELNILLPDAPWLKSASAVKLPSLNPGQSTKVSLLLQPSASQELTVYNGNVVISGDEASLSLPFNFRAISEAKGNLNINVVDELFFFAEGSPRLENATITLLDPFTGTVISSEKDADGILSKTDLAEGYYKLRITADNHDAYEQNIYIGAGKTEEVQAFLSRQTVKYTWTVTPTEIEDKYIITVQSTFETNVPIPVVTIDPPLIDLENLQAVGQVTQINMTVTNHGLIAANDIKLNFGEHPFYKIEPLINNFDGLAAKSSLTIPVRITRIADFDTLPNSAGELSTLATPSVPCSISGSLGWSYPCGGNDVQKSTTIAFNNVEGNCAGGGIGGFGGGGFGGGGFGGGGFGGGSIYSPTPVVLDINPCCVEITLFEKDFSSYFEPFVETAETAVNAYLAVQTGKLAEVDLEVSAEAEVKTCCDPIGISYGASAEGTGRLIIGPNLSQDFELSVPEELLLGSMFSSISLSGEGFIGITVEPYIEIDGFIGEECGEDFKISLSGTVGLDFNAGITGNINAKAEFINGQAPEFEIVAAEGGLFGGLSYTFGYSTSEGFYSSFESSGLYLSAYASAFGYTISPFDNPATPEVETRKYLIDPVNPSNVFEINNIPVFDFDVSSLEKTITEQLQSQANEILSRPEYQRFLITLDKPVGKPENTNNQLSTSEQASVCAQVTIKIDQEAVMTRAAFLGNLEIENGNATNLENLSVILQIKDENGNIVNDKFGITDPILSNITAVDGTGILTGDNPDTPQKEGIGSAQWTFIPTNLAAPETPTQYNIGGTLSYLENGKTITVPLLSTPITVFPQAELYLDYFHQRDVFADDPFTDDIVEPSVPYSLAVLIRNEGKGDAKNLRITSGQPKIVENEKGLLIDFQIIGSEVNGQGVTPSLTVNFGDIKAGKTAVADWLLKSSLQGKFIDYKATFEHTNSLGKAELSLIKEVKIHELIHTVQVNHSNPDNLPDFLVNETFDAQFTPDIIYFSSGGTAPVKAVKNATIDAPPTLNDLTVQISATVENGWTYFRLDEPSNSQYDIVKILRSDGTEIGLDNFWTTDRTFPATGRPIYENILHFLDNNATGGTKTYTVVYTPGGPTITDIIDVSPDPRATAVNAITVDFSEAIQASSFDYNDLSLTLNNGTNLINSTVTIVSLSPTRYQISGLNTLTNNDGDYILTINATGIQDTSGKFGSGSLTETWEKTAGGNADTTPPVVTDIANLLINPRNQPVPSLTVTFSEKIDLSTFTWQDITLTRNSGSNLINNTVTISTINDTTYRINGLSGLTATDGTYNLTVNGSGIQDLSGNSGNGTQSESWVMDTIAPAIPTNITVTNPLTPSGINTASIPLLQPLTVSGQTRINTTNPTISGELGETGLKVFFYDKTTNQLLQQATVTGSQFSSKVQLPSPGARDIEIRVQDTAGNTTNTTLSLFVDTSQPVLTQFLNVPTSTANPINSIDVQFSEQINLNTFDKSDVTLTRDGIPLTLPNTVTVEYISGTNYRINGLSELTNTTGIYSLKVDATTIQDNAGNNGDAAKTTTFTITPPPTPGVTLTQTAGNTIVTEGGNTDTYSLVLKTQPTADVTITLTGNNQITLNSTTLTFTTTNWNTPQNVTVTAVDDTLTEGNHTATITHNISSTDTNYNGLTLPTVNVNIQDNDAEIKGTVWNDIDGNAVNNNEPNLAGWTVYLDTNNNNQLDTGETTTQTDANGDYTFNNLRPGNYNVAQVVQTGWKQTYPILNITTTAADIPLAIPTLELISPSTTNQTELNFNTSNYTVTEDGTAISEIIVIRSGNLTGTVTATLTFTDGTAKGCGCAASSINNDFNHNPITITFAENEISKVIPVQNATLNNPNAIRIRNDNKVEGNEYFTINLTNPTGGATLGNQSQATVTILDDESPNNNPITPPISNPSNTLSNSQNTNATNLINLDDFWSDSRFTNIKGQGQSIVIIDTGADLNHPLFGADANNNGIADKIIYQYDFADNDTDASDKNNHGSHITSIASQIAPDANLIILKVFKDNGSGYFADLEEALQWVNTNANTYNVTSVNLSLGDNQNWTTATGRYGIGDELAAIAGQNILIAAAAGNSFYTFNSTPGLAYPAADPNVISVGAVWADDFGSRTFSNGAKDYTTAADRIASFSQRHPLLDVFAPGILISGANATGGTITMGGTSQAVPYITGIATLGQQIAQTYLGRELTLTEFRTLLDTTSNLIIDGDDENDNVTNTGISYPRINALALAESILTLNDSNSGSGVVNPGNNNNNGSNTVTNSVSLVHNVTLTAGQILTGINFGNQQLPSNQPPTLNNINKSGDEDNALNFSQSDFTSAFNDADGNTLVKIQITALPNNGILQLNNTAIALSQEITVSDLNNLTFTPNTNFNGNVSFSWNGFDGTVYADNAATVNITVNPVDDAPTVLNPITDVNVDEDAANTVIDITNVFTDIDNDIALIVKSVFVNNNTGLVTATIVDNQLILDYQDNQSGTANITIRGTSNGKTVEDTFLVTVNPVDDAPNVLNPITDVNVNEDAVNTVIDISNVFTDIDNDIASIVKSVFLNDNTGLVTATILDNQLTLDYQDNQSGIANLTIRGTSNGKTVDNTFVVNVGAVDNPPTVLNPITDVNVDEDAENSVINLSNVFTDVDGDVIVKSVFVNSNPGLVTATIVDNQLTLDYQDNQSGIANITIRGTSNGKTVDDTLVVTVNPVDNPPTVLNPITDVNVDEDAENSVINLSNVFSDVDGDVIVKSVFVNSNPGLVTATIVDNQLILDYQDNKFGTANITIRGTSNGKTVDDSFTITVASVNDAPTLQQKIANQTATEGQPFSFTIPSNTFNDVDGDTLTYTLAIATVLPSGITFDAATGTFSGTPSDTASGTYNLTLIASDSAGEKANDSFSLNVLNPINGSSSSETINGTSGDDHINAGAGNDNVNGGEGNDILDGGPGNDRLAGGPGDDTYIVDSSRDVVIESAGEGKDTIKSSVNYTLTVNIEDLTLAGNDNTNGTGNNLDNLITGNSGNNLLKGLDGNDTLLGGAGNDTLIGGKGNDILTGGDGSDSFLFGSGAIFNSSDFGVDSISDFIKGSDKIILSKTSFNALVSTIGNNLQAAEFATINDAANELNLVGSSNAKIVYNLATGNLFYNQNGATTGLGNGALFANFNGIPVLNENDILIQA
ncbi:MULTISPECIES: Calx-beta domain-containing protein [unclassified Microcystis]|uniref:Calx-beta domain-containing protein n=1 Tax=unclassified Microcystis TaxID=2643300 RepID=UPI00257C8171|nr:MULTISPECIES: Calx-beta domain-containing protein [unclassified Microcystis]